MNVVIRNGRIIDPGNGTDEIRDLFISAGRIQTSRVSSDGPGDLVLDATGLVVCPGLVDLQARLRRALRCP